MGGPPPLPHGDHWTDQRPVLDYEGPRFAAPPVPHKRAALVYVMAVAWFLVAVFSWASDYTVAVPLPKKLAITAAAIVVQYLLLATASRYAWPVLFLFMARSQLVVIWGFY